MFLKNCWYVAALDHELIDGKLLSRRLLGEHVLLFRGESGQLFALNDRCPHRGAWLSRGRLEGDAVRCMYHGIKFDGSGKCIQIPGQDMIPPKLRVPGHPVAQRGHFIWVWMGDPAKADPALIMDLSYLEDPAWRGIPAYLHYDANYLLIVDNLSDFAHLAFVHTRTLGGSEEYAFVTKPTSIERLPNGFRVERWHRNIDPPPFHRKVIRDRAAKVDRRNIATMLIPGIFTMETLFAPAGQDPLCAGVKEYRNCQFMTPETERTTHFFWQYLNNFEGKDSTISRSLLDSLVEGFMEDKAIIERQQTTLEEDPSFQMLAILADAPLAHFRRLLGKLLDAEQAEASGQPSGTQMSSATS
jgi:phenylpropionate dioxygenase-like ring-hydroxylating dioxygenase large terminal subunit